MGQQVLAIAVVLTITGSKNRTKKQDIKTPDAPKACIIHSIIKTLKFTLIGIIEMRLLREGLMVVHTIEIPALHCFQVTAMTWDGVMVPIPAMGEDVLKSEHRRHIIRDWHRDNMDKCPTLGLEQESQLLQGLGQVAHMAKTPTETILSNFSANSMSFRSPSTKVNLPELSWLRGSLILGRI